MATPTLGPWDTLACCWDIKQPTNNLYNKSCHQHNDTCHLFDASYLCHPYSSTCLSPVQSPICQLHNDTGHLYTDACLCHIYNSTCHLFRDTCLSHLQWSQCDGIFTIFHTISVCLCHLYSNTCFICTVIPVTHTLMPVYLYDLHSDACLSLSPVQLNLSVTYAILRSMSLSQ